MKQHSQSFGGKAVTAVVPAYNEEENISVVLHALQDVPALSQIVVVDDGSTDRTAAVVKAQQQQDGRLQYLLLPVNRGKGVALTTGANAATNDLLLFLDADLIDLKQEHVSRLIRPVQQGVCEMTLGVFRNGRRQTDWSHRLMPFLSGQRCLRWSLFRHAPQIAQTRWSIEVALSFFAWRRNYRVQHVAWNGVTHQMRPEKSNRLLAYWSHVQMWSDIGRYLASQYLAEKRPTARRTPSTSKVALKLARRFNTIIGDR